jgi:hypothetical protein
MALLRLIVWSRAIKARSDRRGALFHPLGAAAQWLPFECPAVAGAHAQACMPGTGDSWNFSYRATAPARLRGNQFRLEAGVVRPALERNPLKLEHIRRP